jgi:hypothetical protein
MSEICRATIKRRTWAAGGELLVGGGESGRQSPDFCLPLLPLSHGLLQELKRICNERTREGGRVGEVRSCANQP